MGDSLPSGWNVGRLGDIAHLIGGGTPSKQIDSYFNGNILWATVRDMNVDIIENTEIKISESGLRNSSSKIVPKGNIIIATRVGVGKVCRNKFDTAINQDLRGVCPNNQTDIQFLFYFLKSVSGYLQSISTGATVKGIHAEQVAELPIPLPPLPEQHRIVAKLDSMFVRIDRAIELAQQNIVRAQQFMSSVLNEIFDNPEWEMVPFHSVVSNNSKTIIPLPNERYNIIGLEHIARDIGRLVDFHPMYGRESRSSKVVFKKDTVLYGKLRPYLNKVYVAEFDGIASTEILPFITDTDSLLPTFLAAYLRSPRFLARVNENCAGARMPRVTTKFWNDVMVPHPNTTTQNQIVNFLHSIEKEQDSLLCKQQQRLAELLALKSSLLDATFKGEL